MSFSLADKLYANKSFSKVVEVLGLSIEFQKLSAPEEEEVVRSSSATNYIELLQVRRIPTLARTIRSIDGVEVKDFDEIKQRLHSNPAPSVAQAFEAELRCPEKYPEEVVSALYVAYMSFLDEYRNFLGGLKKTSAPLSPETVG